MVDLVNVYVVEIKTNVLFSGDFTQETVPYRKVKTQGSNSL